MRSIAFHTVCNAYEQWINGTTTTTSSSSAPSSTSIASATPTRASVNDSVQKTPIGPIIGGAVGGVVGLALIIALVYLISLWLKGKDRRQAGGSALPSNISQRSNEPMAFNRYSSPYPHPSLAPNYSSSQPTPRDLRDFYAARQIGFASDRPSEQEIERR
ncbi:hypothetical protein BDV93DRAFT_561825 [Ceratobasidium sp. AG-I]|nr:hypothetical protein BDV93DRAFT_561825 [Ceratobasidium sp. AG-I]